MPGTFLASFISGPVAPRLLVKSVCDLPGAEPRRSRTCNPVFVAKPVRYVARSCVPASRSRGAWPISGCMSAASTGSALRAFAPRTDHIHSPAACAASSRGMRGVCAGRAWPSRSASVSSRHATSCGGSSPPTVSPYSPSCAGCAAARPTSSAASAWPRTDRARSPVASVDGLCHHRLPRRAGRDSTSRRER